MFGQSRTNRQRLFLRRRAQEKEEQILLDFTSSILMGGAQGLLTLVKLPFVRRKRKKKQRKDQEKLEQLALAAFLKQKKKAKKRKPATQKAKTLGATGLVLTGIFAVAGYVITQKVMK